jgi:preprotein translocase subunit SecE
MSRAIRRQQAAAQKAEAQQQARRPTRSLGGGAGGQPPSRGARPPTQPRRRLHLGSPHWLEEIISELKKVSWPTRDETLYLTMVVIVVSVTVGIILGGIDLFFSWLIDRLLLD